MKNLSVLFRAALAVFAVIACEQLMSLHAAPPDREGLPPGLQKKDKLPPGWQKKVGQTSSTDANAVTNAAPTTGSTSTTRPVPPTTTTPPTIPPTPPNTGDVRSKPEVPAPPTKPTTTTTTTTTTTATTSASPTWAKPLTREQRENLARMERALSDLEMQAVRPGASDRLLHRLSNRLNIPMATLQDQLKTHAGLSITHLYLATVMAKKSQLSLEQILQERKAGGAWGEIAHNHRLSYSDLTERLRDAEDAAREAANEEQAKVRRQAQRAN